MKAILDKALGMWTHSSEPERSRAVQQAHSVEARDDPLLHAASAEQLPLDSMFSDECGTVEDNVLFRKNGVFLKYPGILPEGDLLSRGCSKTPQPLKSEVAATKMDSHVLVPGYFFIASRGSNFGSTLILNWASNRALTHSCASCHPLERGDNTISGDHTEIQSCRVTCSGQHGFSVSIDLCTMEVIRLFCRNEDEGSGELVLKSEDQTFKVSGIFSVKHCQDCI